MVPERLHWDINRVPSAQPALFALPQVARLITRLARNNLKRMREECARAFVAFERTNIWCERARTEKYTKSGLRTFISTDAVAHKNSVIGCWRLKWRRIKRREREKEKMKDLRGDSIRQNWRLQLGVCWGLKREKLHTKTNCCFSYCVYSVILLFLTRVDKICASFCFHFIGQNSPKEISKIHIGWREPKTCFHW